MTERNLIEEMRWTLLNIQAMAERDHLIRCHKPQFIKWTDWILDGDAVTYGGGGYCPCYHG